MRIFPCLVLLASAGLCAERWSIQYFYDEDESSLTLNDLQFTNADSGLAVGFLSEGAKSRPVVLATADGGRNWIVSRGPEVGLSLFRLTEKLGWMVARNGIYRTGDAGRTWKKLKSPSGILRVHFQDENHGWAVGARKSVYATTDGGEHWTRLAAADEPKANPEFTAYGWITFANEKAGIITGWSSPPRPDERRRLPDWMEPEKAQRRREWPSLGILIDTRDGGKTWRPSVTSMFGRISRVRLCPDGRGLGLIEFLHAFEYPSEVFLLDWRAGKSVRVFRRKDRAVTDVALLPGGPAYLAAIEPQGQRLRLPVPGKLKLLRSTNFSDWQEMEVDYRALARRAVISAVDPANIWVATDTGMILKLDAQ